MTINEYEERARAFKAARIAELLIEATGTPVLALEAAKAVVDMGEYDRFRMLLADAADVHTPSIQTMRVVVEILGAKVESRGAKKFAAWLEKKEVSK